MIAPDPTLPQPIVPNAIVAEIILPEVIPPAAVVPQVIAPGALAAEVILPEHIAAQVIVPDVIAPQVVAPEVIAPAPLVPDIIPAEPVVPQSIAPLPIAPGGSTAGSRSVEGASATATTGSCTRQAWRPGGDAGSVLQGRYTINEPCVPSPPSHPGRSIFDIHDPVVPGLITGLHHRLPADVPPGHKCLCSLSEDKHSEPAQPITPEPLASSFGFSRMKSSATLHSAPDSAKAETTLK